jgi:hypothetical protein
MTILLTDKDIATIFEKLGEDDTPERSYKTNDGFISHTIDVYPLLKAQLKRVAELLIKSNHSRTVFDGVRYEKFYLPEKDWAELLREADKV